jgi:hypothetical protein
MKKIAEMAFFHIILWKSAVSAFFSILYNKKNAAKMFFNIQLIKKERFATFFSFFINQT